MTHTALSGPRCYTPQLDRCSAWFAPTSQTLPRSVTGKMQSNRCLTRLAAAGMRAASAANIAYQEPSAADDSVGQPGETNFGLSRPGCITSSFWRYELPPLLQLRLPYRPSPVDVIRWARSHAISMGVISGSHKAYRAGSQQSQPQPCHHWRGASPCCKEALRVSPWRTPGFAL